MKPIAKRVIYQTLQPVGPTKHIFAGMARAGFYAREAFEWGRRSMVATPAFLAQCATYGENIAIDRVPYINGTPRIELGSNIRVSGLLGIAASSKGTPTLVIGDGVFIGHGVNFNVASRITINVTTDAGLLVGDTWISKRMNNRGVRGFSPATSDVAAFRITAGFKHQLRKWLEDRTGLTADFVYPTVWHQPHQETFAKSHGRLASIV